MLLYVGMPRTPESDAEVARLLEDLNKIRAQTGQPTITTTIYTHEVAAEVAKFQALCQANRMKLSGFQQDAVGEEDIDGIAGQRTQQMLRQAASAQFIAFANARSGYVPFAETPSPDNVSEAPAAAIPPVTLPDITAPRITLPNLTLPALPRISMPDLGGVRSAFNAFLAPTATAQTPDPSSRRSAPLETMDPVSPLQVSATISPVLTFTALTPQWSEQVLADIANNPAKTEPTLADMELQLESFKPVNNPIRITVNDIVPEAEFAETARRVKIPPSVLRTGLEKTVREINTMAYAVRAPFAEGLYRMYQIGIPAVLADGHRSAADQLNSRSAGHSNAGPGESYHNYGVAGDLVLLTRDGNLDYGSEAFSEMAEGRDGRRRSVLETMRHTMDEIGFRRFTDPRRWGFNDDPLHFTLGNEYTTTARQFAAASIGAARSQGSGLEESEVEDMYVPESAVPAAMRRAAAALRLRRPPVAEEVKQDAPRDTPERHPVRHVVNMAEEMGQNLSRGLRDGWRGLFS